MQTKVVWPSDEHIARVAYRIYLERGAASGPAREDWVQAELLLLAHLNNPNGTSTGPAPAMRNSEQRP